MQWGGDESRGRANANAIHIESNAAGCETRQYSSTLKAPDLAILEFKFSEFNDTEWCILYLKGHGTQKPCVKAL